MTTPFYAPTVSYSLRKALRVEGRPEKVAFFGLVLVVATVFFHPGSTVWAFLLASAVTLGAGVGEVIMVLLVLREMQFQGNMPASEVGITQGLQLAACRSPGSGFADTSIHRLVGELYAKSHVRGFRRRARLPIGENWPPSVQEMTGWHMGMFPADHHTGGHVV